MATPTKSVQELNQDEANVPGQPIRLGRLFYILPPAPLVHMPKLQAVLKGGDFTTDANYSNALVDALFYSLRRNYTDISRETVADNLDMTNFTETVEAFMKANNLQRVEGGAPAGEATGS